MKWILRYLRGTASFALSFKQSDLRLQCYIDANMAGDVDGRKSYTLGGTTITWVSKLQKIVVISNTEAEYVTVTKASKEMIWLKSFLEELVKSKGKTYYIVIVRVPFIWRIIWFIMLGQSTYNHFIRSTLEDGVLVFEKILGSLTPTDMLNKTVPVEKLKLCATSIGLLLEA